MYIFVTAISSIILSQLKLIKLLSQLGIELIKADGAPFEYANEFGVQRLCIAMVDDALLTLGLTDCHMKSHLEISICMMKPGIMLVTVLSDAVYQQLLSLLRVVLHEDFNIKETTFKWASDPEEKEFNFKATY
jgi:hypothetical protein